MIPNRHGEQGWFQYIPHASSNNAAAAHACVRGGTASGGPGSDPSAVRRRPLPKDQPLPRCGKAGSFPIHEWFEYIVGRNPEFPERALEITHAEMRRRLDRIDSESVDWTPGTTS